jgi:prepilin-type N-terminal cleavage/methylation domain-containing protein
MKTERNSQGSRGFTLVELLTAMVITTIIVGVLVSITSVALDTWNRSRAELRASRQAKAMIDTVARDFESLVLRRGNNYEWLSARFDNEQIGENIKSTNASKLIFFTGSNDRYNGQIGVSGQDNGGDISCVGYQLQYKNPMTSTEESGFETFVFNRLLVDPDKTFENLLGKEDLESAFSKYQSDLVKPENFICENVLQFTMTFHVEVTELSSGSGAPKIINVPVKIGGSGEVADSFKFNGQGIDTPFSGGSVTSDQLKSGKISAVEISVTVLTDYAIDQLRNRKFNTTTQEAEFITKNSYEYTKSIQIPSL